MIISPCSTDSTDEVRRLGMGRLLSDVSVKMQKKAVKGDGDPMRMLVHSTHDTTLAGICASFDVFDERQVYQVTCSLCLSYLHSLQVARLHIIHLIRAIPQDRSTSADTTHNLSMAEHSLPFQASQYIGPLYAFYFYLHAMTRY